MLLEERSDEGKEWFVVTDEGCWVAAGSRDVFERSGEKG